MKICKRCLVSGKVQGVFYRASTAEQAHSLEITGYAMNLPDGRVEVLACGEEAKVRELIDWLWKGPPAAKVTGVDVQEADAAHVPADFSTR
jgi:acylphosphatase